MQHQKNEDELVGEGVHFQGYDVSRDIWSVIWTGGMMRKKLKKRTG